MDNEAKPLDVTLEEIQGLWEEKCKILTEWIEYLFGPMGSPSTYPETGESVSFVYTYDLNKALEIEKKHVDRIFWVVEEPRKPEDGVLVFPTEADREMAMEFLDQEIAIWEVLYYCLKYKAYFTWKDYGDGRWSKERIGGDLNPTS